MEAQPQAQTYEYPQQYQSTDPSTTTTTITATATTAAYQVQPYDPNTYYASYPNQQQQPPYPTSTTNPDYSTTASASYYYPPHPHPHPYPPAAAPVADPNSLHPPGVPLSADPYAAYYHSSYYQAGQPAYGAGGTQGGRSTRGSGRGSFGRGKGRGRGGGRGPQTSSSSAATQDAPSKPPPQMVWCELCRVDCNTLEILEKHRNGKKHQKNLKVFEGLQNQQIAATQLQPEATQVSAMVDTTVAQPSEEGVKRDSSGGRGGLKRKMRGGRGGAKWVRGLDGSKRLIVEPPKPKPQMVHLFCELCNVKCESQVVYASHIAGKKHLSNLKKYEGHKEIFGESQVGALYPTFPNPMPSTISVAPHQSNPQVEVPQDAQALASMMLSHQNLPDPQAAQAALAQLLAQHGVHDAQTLLVQLIPYLLTQPQVPGSVPVIPAAGFGTEPLYPQTQGPHVSTEVAGQSEGQNGETVTEQQNLPSTNGSEAVVVKSEAEAVVDKSEAVVESEKPDDVPSKAVKVEAK